MTTATIAPARTAPARPRQARWLLRLHRPALYTWAALVVALAAALLALHGPLADAAAQGWRQYNACTTPRCRYDQSAIIRYKDAYNWLTYALDALPLLVAAWAGATLTARELETGTARLAWTQAVSPARWLAVRLAVPAVLVTAGTSLLFWLHRLAWEAGRGRIDTRKSWYDIWTFHANGPTTAALALAGLAAGALAGLLIRRTLPALVLGMAVTVGVQSLAQQLMPHLWPTVTEVSDLKAGGPTGVGISLGQGLVTRTGARLPLPDCFSEAQCDAALRRAHAVGYFNTYHPASHYWPLQLLTTALLLTAAALLALASFRVLRRLTS
ncbi:ABC transporter permease [Streptomyces sp. NPDC001606]